jgi:quinohemoprotein ethanol dehydrogenase
MHEVVQSLKDWVAVLTVPLVLAAASPGIDSSSIERPAVGEWLSYGRTYDEQRFSPLAQIDHDSVSRLGLAWWVQFDTDRGQEATPLEHAGVLYTTTAWSKVFAFDARTGARLWSYDPRVPGEKAFNACCDVVNRGLALWGDKVFVGTLDGRLVALDLKSGQVRWTAQTTNPARPYTITGAPRAIDGKILIGNAGSEFPVRGYVSAYDAQTGRLSWRFYMTPNAKGEPDHAASDEVMKDRVAATWRGGAWRRGGGGGSPWDAITYDPRVDLIFIGTGNAGPWNDAYRSAGGDNLFAASIVALRPETGEYVWHYQTTPRDAWDYDAVQQLVTADLMIHGVQRHVVMQANKNGFFYVLDAATGRLISAAKFAFADWADHIDLATGRPVESRGVRYTRTGEPSLQSPGPVGGHNWQPMAFNSKEGLVYIPSQRVSGYYARGDSSDPYIEGARNDGLGARLDRPQSLNAPPPSPSAQRYGELIAWDPVAQKARWRVRFPQFWHSGVLATAGGLVFHAVGHELTALDAHSGQIRWRYDTLVNPVAPPMTYMIDGVQYVALMVGYGGSMAFGSDQLRHPGRLLVFKLGGTARLAPYPPTSVPPPLNLGLAIASNGNAQAGAVSYRRLCSACHRTGDFLPNLARSPAILTPTAFQAIVLGGALKQNGMAPFSRYLSPSAAEDLRAYLLSEARDSGHASAYEPSKPSEGRSRQ